MEAEKLLLYLPFHQYVVYSLSVTLLLVGGSFLITRRLAADVPGGAQNAVEALLEFLQKPLAEHFEHDVAEKVLPFLGSFFLFILVANWLGILPGAKPPTADINTTLGLSISAVISFQVLNVMINGGIGALKQFFMKPVAIIGGILKLIDNGVRVVSLAIRLFGNLAGEHLVFEIVSGIAMLKLVFPVILLLLGTLVGGIQAVVFSMLSLNYLAEEIRAHEEEEAEADVPAEESLPEDSAVFASSVVHNDGLSASESDIGQAE